LSSYTLDAADFLSYILKFIVDQINSPYFDTYCVRFSWRYIK